MSRGDAALRILLAMVWLGACVALTLGPAHPAQAWWQATEGSAPAVPAATATSNTGPTESPPATENASRADPLPTNEESVPEDRGGLRLRWEPVGNWMLVVAVIGVMFGLLLLAPSQGKLTRQRRTILTAIRSVVILLLFLVMMRPTLTYRTVERQSAQLFVVIDMSRSMQTKDDGAKTRWALIQDLIYESMPDFAELAENLDVQFVVFDSELKPVPFADGKLDWRGIAPEGDESAIGWTLAEIRRRAAGKRVVGVVMLTDGHQQANSPKDLPPLQAADRVREFPVFPVVIGKTDAGGRPRDIELLELVANRTVFVKNQLAVSGVARLSGFVNQDVTAQLLFETSPGQMEVVDTMQIKSDRDGQQIPIQLSYAPQEPGEYKLSLKLVPQPGELIINNNERSSFVTVLDGGLNVLYVEGALRVEQRFLRQSLDASPDINVDYLRLDARRPNQRADSVNQKLTEGLKPGKYNAIILGDVDSLAFQKGELQAIRDCVSAGTGLIMLGGFHTFGPGGYAGTPLEDVLPVRMDRFERQQLDDPVRADLHLPGPLKMTPRRLAGQHFLTQLAPASANAARWAELPPLDGANRLTSREATVLLETEKQSPLLLAGAFGDGRVLAFGADSTWRWWTHGFQNEHRRFWRQVILWLAQRDDVRQGKVWVETDQPRIRIGAPIQITAGAYDPQGGAVRDARFEAELVAPDGARSPLKLTQRGDEFSATLNREQTPLLGDYTVLVKASDANGELGDARTRFLVFEEDLELTRPEADLTTMQGVADRTPGGRVYAPEEFSVLLARLKDAPKSLEKPIDSPPTALWDKWPIMLLFIVLLCGEWALRKKWGLV